MSEHALPDRRIVGWDIGGAHVKACVLDAGRTVDVMQWACPLWQGLGHLEAVLAEARARWPEASAGRHAVTMTGEMVDLFDDREDGVARIADAMARALPPAADLRFFAGEAWCSAADAATRWREIASANWLATARHIALCLPERDGVLVDIGSTTTDFIAFANGRVTTTSRTDAQRLATGELVYMGVVRTPLCALARQIPWAGRSLNVMNEFFATTADLFRLTDELDPATDLYPAADNAAKDLAGSRKRIARMIGLDARDGSDAEWLGFARAWRTAQVDEMANQLRRVRVLHGLSPNALVVSAGCGDFLADEVWHAAGGRGAGRRYGQDIARAIDAGTARRAQVCAPSAAVAALLARDIDRSAG